VAVGALLVFLLLHLLWRRGTRDDDLGARPAGRSATVLALLALAVALTSAAVNARSHASHLLVDGDPAVYAVTGTLLARTGGLTVPTDDVLFGGEGTVEHAGAGFFDSADERTVYPQFLHLLPVLLAVASWLGGVPLLLLVTPLLGAAGLLALYCLAARLVHPAWALLATGTLAVLLPQLHFSRDTFSEVPSQLLVLTGLSLLWDLTAPERLRAGARISGPAWGAGLVAGLVLGASAMARIDAFLYFVPLAAALVLLRAGRTGLAVAAGAALSASVALADGGLGSPAYLASGSTQLWAVGAALAGVGVVALVMWRAAPPWVARTGRQLAWPAAGVVVALAAFAWFVRPSVAVVREATERTSTLVAALQQAEGLAWYVGPVTLALAVGGLAWLTARLLRGQDLRLAPFVLLVGVITAVYVWKPGIVPVHYWASRRFLPVSFPGLVLLAVLVCDRLWRLPRRAARPVAALLGAGVVGFPSAALPGAALPASYDGLVPAVEAMCGSLLPDDVVLLVGGTPVTDGLPQVVEGVCGVPAGSAGRRTTTADVRQVSAAVRAQGRRLVVLSPVPDPDDVPDELAFRPVFDVTVPTPALSLSGRPDEVYPYRLRLFGAFVEP
jgi:hypothetical protein